MAQDQRAVTVTIECEPKGPLIIRNLESLRNSKGEPLPTRQVVALCRCGASAKKPFCDGSHTKVAFSDEKRTDGSLNKRDNYVGTTITIHDNRGICSHASVCADELESVFNADREPWVNPEGASLQSIIDVIKKCPSGALSYTIGGVEHRDEDRPPAITVSKNGPYCVVGRCELKDVIWGEGASQEHYALCRCGGSTNLPFCDGTHRNNNFRDDKN